MKRFIILMESNLCLQIFCALLLTASVLYVAASCSERAAEPKPIDQCENAQAFRLWVIKYHPEIFNEYTSNYTHCGDSL